MLFISVQEWNNPIPNSLTFLPLIFAGTFTAEVFPE